MRTLGLAFCCFVLGLLALSVTPAARADTGPIDCTNGCTIVTCATTPCTVWHCDSNGCIPVGQYQRIPHPQAAPQPQASVQQYKPAFDQVCDIAGKQPCAVKTCQGDRCTILMFDGKSFVTVGQVDNVEKMIERANTQRVEGH
ncbi:MAG TPA: hypothetical protein VF216_01485 [Mizugakiibacter sp.]